MESYVLEVSEPLTLVCDGRLAGMYVLSPFVWREANRFHILLRAVPRRDDEPRLKMAEIWYGTSSDGLSFDMDQGPTIYPGPDAVDLDGCEDPTVWCDDGTYYVWYTGWNHAEQVGRLLMASGSSPRTLAKVGIAIDSVTDFINPKEATVVRTASGAWKIFFEYARNDASCIGIAESDNPLGPWTRRETMLEPRGDSCANWHLSTGPIVNADSDRPVMFYNGASRDAHWRTGWVAFDRDFECVVDRGDLPVITPEVSAGGDMTDIAFASSAIEMEGELWLYHSISDQHLRRARVRPV